jgi:hypothetical protein
VRWQVVSTSSGEDGSFEVKLRPKRWLRGPGAPIYLRRESPQGSWRYKGTDSVATNRLQEAADIAAEEHMNSIVETQVRESSELDRLLQLREDPVMYLMEQAEAERMRAAGSRAAEEARHHQQLEARYRIAAAGISASMPDALRAGR